MSQQIIIPSCTKLEADVLVAKPLSNKEGKSLVNLTDGYLTDGPGLYYKNFDGTYTPVNSPMPVFNNPFDFYLDSSAPVGGDGSIEKPFKTITELNNAVIALGDPSTAIVANVAPGSYGSEVVGFLQIAPNLSLVGLVPQNTGISCDIHLTAGAFGIINQYRQVAFNGVFTIDLALATFSSVVFQNGVVTLNRIDTNPSGFVILQGGIGGCSIAGGNILINSGVMFGDINIGPGALVYCTNLFILGGAFKLTGNCTLYTLSTLNPFDGYVDGTVDGSGTPTWKTDLVSNADYTGVVNKTVIGEDDEWIFGGNAVTSEQAIGTKTNFDFPIIVNGLEITRITKDKRQFWNDIATNNGSNAGLQYSSLTGNRAQLRQNQYGANNAGGGLTTFKSRGLVIGAPLDASQAVQVGDIIQGLTGIAVTGSGLLIPLAYTQRVTAVDVTAGNVACDWEIQLCPIGGATNSIRKVLGVTSEGIQKVRESANSMAGLATLDAAGQFVVPNTNVKATTRFLLTAQDGGTFPTGNMAILSRTNGVDFTIKSTAGAADAGVVVYYQLYEQLT